MTPFRDNSSCFLPWTQQEAPVDEFGTRQRLTGVSTSHLQDVLWTELTLGDPGLHSVCLLNARALRLRPGLVHSLLPRETDSGPALI
ncbi:hypothetical protein RRG08_024446 [Elysia crispata]|uniref:Uncharacterized protein n=1 Tax=Elysia crispata TaxID=231223 RepID=A0AAE0YP32_9GAST|nr:hypothetical protein RRG08_024446 [Elysia crispata]